MAAGTARYEGIRCATAHDTGGIGKYLAVKAGAVADEVALAGANARILGVTIEAVTATDAPIQYCYRGVVPWTASGAINRLTSSVPTRIVSAASGKCQALPTSADTYWVVGEMDNSSADATTDGDIVHVKLFETPYPVTVT